ncbi:hypothetical protein [Cyclobacterium xiamenense]|uniref:hypothetical protein n=1 Tax=Cyclobacterium xiamenense TaxID=1297121 RepID=UPI0035D0E741
MPKTSNTYYLVYEIKSIDKDQLKKLVAELRSTTGMIPFKVMDYQQHPIKI